MKSKEMQTIVKNKYENPDEPAKIYRDLSRIVSLGTMKSWVHII